MTSIQIGLQFLALHLTAVVAVGVISDALSFLSKAAAHNIAYVAATVIWCLGPVMLRGPEGSRPILTWPEPKPNPTDSRPGGRWGTWGSSLPVLGALLVVAASILGRLGTPGMTYLDDRLSTLLSPATSITLDLVLFAPLREEMLYRGFLFRRLSLTMGMLPAALISSLVFASRHPNVLGSFALGLLYCALYSPRMVGWLGLTMLLHAWRNLTSTGVPGMP
jgi:membrane protease YdiL (CAAX protease family)